MKRILIFSLAYVPYVGGAELAVKEITDRLYPHAYHIDMITLRWDHHLPEIERVGNITVYRIGAAVHDPKVSDRALPWQLRLAKIFFPVTSFFKALSLHRIYQYDMVWALLANQASFGALFFKLTHPSVKYFLELQDGNSLARLKARRPILNLLWPLYKVVYTKADVIKVISNFIENLAREIGYHGRIEIIPNGVDVAKFSESTSEEKLPDLKLKYDKAPGDIFLVTVSRLVLSRGVEEVIRALVELPPHVKFLVIGDGEDREKLAEIARESHVEERVMFAGAATHDELPALLHACDIFVRPSHIEGMGSAFIEAFAAGVPVVATPVGGIPDFLFDPEKNPEHDPTGIFCIPRDPKSVALAVKRYLDNPDLVATVVRNARHLAVQKYDWKSIAYATEMKIFSEIAEK